MMYNNLIWFKDNLLPFLQEYEVNIDNFKNGDFGDLDRIEFNSEMKGGEINIWSSGWLGVNLVDYISGKEVVNFFFRA